MKSFLFLICVLVSSTGFALTEQTRGSFEVSDGLVLRDADSNASLSFRPGRYEIEVLQQDNLIMSDKLLVRYNQKTYSLDLSSEAIKKLQKNVAFASNLGRDFVVRGRSQLVRQVKREEEKELFCTYCGYCGHLDENSQLKFGYSDRCSGTRRELREITKNLRQIQLEFYRGSTLIASYRSSTLKAQESERTKAQITACE